MCGFLVVRSEEFELQVFQKALDKAAYRGPDYQHVSIDHGITWGFNRLSIMDLSTNGNQPFVYKDYTLVCNGEIYNYPALKTKLESSYTFKSGSDCEVLIPLYEQYGLEILCKYLDAEFALVLYDNKTKQLMAARDPMGIRPMFYGYSKKEHQICFASEAKALFDLCDDIMPFPPGHYYLDGQFVCYNDLSDPKTIVDDDLETIAGKLKTKLEKEETEAKVIKAKKEQTTIVLQNTITLQSSYAEKLTSQERQLQEEITKYKQEQAKIEYLIRQATNSSIDMDIQYTGGTMLWPVAISGTAITSTFGYREHPIQGVVKEHTGLDIGNATYGSPVVAAADGVVTYAGWLGGYGNCVMISHGNGLVTLYGHGQKILTELHKEVKQGDLIMEVGSTGNSTGPHLHFEVRLNGDYVNPLNYVKVP